MKKLITLASVSLFAVSAFAAGEEKTVKGEILDLTCYADHGGSGEKHEACAQKCIASGLPVGIKGEDGTVYFVVGDHKPINKELASHAGKTVTLKGKAVSKDGMHMLENAELVQ